MSKRFLTLEDIHPLSDWEASIDHNDAVDALVYSCGPFESFIDGMRRAETFLPRMRREGSGVFPVSLAVLPESEDDILKWYVTVHCGVLEKEKAA